MLVMILLLAITFVALICVALFAPDSWGGSGDSENDPPHLN